MSFSLAISPVHKCCQLIHTRHSCDEAYTTMQTLDVKHSHGSSHTFLTVYGKIKCMDVMLLLLLSFFSFTPENTADPGLRAVQRSHTPLLLSFR